LHELTECYQGALISQKSGISASPATQADEKNPASVYYQAHNILSVKQPGNMSIDMSTGNVVVGDPNDKSKQKTIQVLRF